MRAARSYCAAGKPAALHTGGVRVSVKPNGGIVHSAGSGEGAKSVYGLRQQCKLGMPSAVLIVLLEKYALLAQSCCTSINVNVSGMPLLMFND